MTQENELIDFTVQCLQSNINGFRKIINKQKQPNKVFEDTIKANYKIYQNHISLGLSSKDSLNNIPNVIIDSYAYSIQFPNTLNKNNYQKINWCLSDDEKIRILNHIDNEWYKQHNLIFNENSQSIDSFYALVLKKLNHNQYWKTDLLSISPPIMKLLLKNPKKLKFFYHIFYCVFTSFWLLCIFATISPIIVGNEILIPFLSILIIILGLFMSDVFWRILISIIMKDFNIKRIFQYFDNNFVKFDSDDFPIYLLGYYLYQKHDLHPIVTQQLSHKLTFSLSHKKTYFYKYAFLKQQRLHLALKNHQKILEEIDNIVKKHPNLEINQLDLSNIDDVSDEYIGIILEQYKQSLIKLVLNQNIVV